MEDKVLDQLKISHIKFTNGDEIVALVRNIDARHTNMIVEMPLAINTMHSGEDRETFYFTEWMPMSGYEIHINMSTIITHSECTDSFKEHYVRTALSFKEKPSTSFTSEWPDDEDDDIDYEEDVQANINKTMH